MPQSPPTCTAISLGAPRDQYQKPPRKKRLHVARTHGDVATWHDALRELACRVWRAAVRSHMLSHARRGSSSAPPAAWVGLVALAIGCAGARDKPVAAGAPTTPSALPTATSNGTATPGPGQSASADASASAAANASTTSAAASVAPPLTPFEPRTVRCGAQSCKAGSETCCWFGQDSGCAPTTPGNREPELLKQSQQCMDRVKSDVALSAVARCDDAADCGPKESCCRVEPLGRLELSLCMPFDRGRSGCDLGERFVPEVKCKTPGTTCIEGQCRLGGKPECMGKTCDASAPICCGKFDWQGKPSCKAAKDCAANANVYECFKPSDCPKGETCQSLMTGTRCLGKVATSGRMVVCEKDADCPKGMCPPPTGAPRPAPAPQTAGKSGKGGKPGAVENGPVCAPIERDSWSNLMTCQCPGAEKLD
jgi:hypothetical protein